MIIHYVETLTPGPREIGKRLCLHPIGVAGHPEDRKLQRDRPPRWALTLPADFRAFGLVGTEPK